MLRITPVTTALVTTAFIAASALIAGSLNGCGSSDSEEIEDDSPSSMRSTSMTSMSNPLEEALANLPTKQPPPPGAIPAPDDVAEAPADAERTESGIASKVLQAGTGTEHPTAESEVKVHYTGWKTDGEMFDSSMRRGEPATFPLSGVIAGWTEGVQLMVVGEKRRFWIPENLAYGGRPGAPSGMLVFDIELLEIIAPPVPQEAPPAPRNVAAAPRNAETTESGLASRVLEAGSGTDHPTATSNVSVHYTGWTTDGEMFDSSLPRGRVTSFGLNQVIPGWTEGLQLMVVGEKRRLWIPENLAYGGRPGRPAGMLVFDVELVSID